MHSWFVNFVHLKSLWLILILRSLIFFFSSICSVMGYTLLLSLIEYKTLVMRGDLDRANEVLPSIPKEHHNRCLVILDL